MKLGDPGVLPNTWRGAIGKAHQRVNMVNYEKSEEILKYLKLNEDYNKNFELIDCYPGCGVWSRALHKHLEPKVHVMLESFDNYYSWNKDGYNRDLSASKVIQVDPYKWKVYNLLERYGAYKPEHVPFDQVNKSLLYTGQFTTAQGGQLLSQFITCIAYRNWIQKFGRIRMLLWVRDTAAFRAVATPEEPSRGKLSALVSLYADIDVVAASDANDFKRQDTKTGRFLERIPALRNAPIKFSVDDTFMKGPLVLLDVKPKEQREWESEISAHEMEYVLRNLFITPKMQLRTSINTLGAGAGEYFESRLGHLYNKTTHQLAPDEFVEIFQEFKVWPYKPEHLFDLGEDDLDSRTKRDVIQFL
ncbi:ribosomal RNA adenine methyltransferase KsgA/Erm [Lipomyces doorenjongii]